MDKDQEIKNLTKEIHHLQEELTTQKSNYKRLSSELGQSIFENEDLDMENRKLKREIEELKEENKKLKAFKEEVESSTSYKIKSIFK